MSGIEDMIRSVPEERLYLALISLAAGMYATYLATQMPGHGFNLFGPALLVLGIVLLTPHSSLLNKFLEPMFGVGGLTMMLPYAQETMRGDPTTASTALLVFGMLLLVTSIVSLVYEGEE